MIDIYEIPTLPTYSLWTCSPTSGGLWPLAAISTISASLSLFVSGIPNPFCIFYYDKFYANKFYITMIFFRRSFFTFSQLKYFFSTSFTSCAIEALKIFLFTSAIPIFSPRNLVPSYKSPLVTLLDSLFYVSTIHSFSIASLFAMHKLCKTMHVATIYGIFPKSTSNHFIINLHLPFKIPNTYSMHILVKGWIKFHFVSFSNNAIFSPLNKQYIQGLTGYTASPTNSYG